MNRQELSIFNRIWNISYLVFCLTILSFLVWPYLVTANLDSRVVFAFDSDEANHIELLKQALETSGFDFNFHGYGHLFFNIALITLRFFSTLDLPTDQIIIIVLRSISLISGLLCVSITFFLAKRFFGQSCAILSTAFLVAIPLEFQSYAGISHPDLLQLVFVQLALYYCCLCATSKRFLHLKIASAFSGIAFATKYSGLFLLPLLFVQSFGLHPTSLRFSLPQVRLLRLTTFVFAAVSAAIGVISTPEFVLKVTHSNDQLLSSEAALLFTLRITAMIVAGLALVLVLYKTFWEKLLISPLLHSIATRIVQLVGYFCLAAILSSPFLVKHFRFLKGMLVESLHVSFGHGFKSHQPIQEWIHILFSNQLLGPTLGTIASVALFAFLIKITKPHSLTRLYSTKLLSSPRTILWIWVAIYLSYMLLRVRYREARYLFLVLPSLIVLSADFICIFSNILAKRAPTIIKSHFKTLSMLVICCPILAYHLRSSLRHRSHIEKREQRSTAMLLGNMLIDRFPFDTSIAHDPSVYVPVQFTSTIFQWRWTEADLLNSGASVFILNETYRHQFSDLQRAQDFYWGPKLFTEVRDFYSKIEDGSLGYFKLLESGEYYVYSRAKGTTATPSTP